MVQHCFPTSPIADLARGLENCAKKKPVLEKSHKKKEKSHHFISKSACFALFFGEPLEVPLVSNLTLKCGRDFQLAS